MPDKTEEVQAITKNTRIHIGSAIAIMVAVLYAYMDGVSFVNTTVRALEESQDETNNRLALTNESLAGLRSDVKNNTEAMRQLQNGYVTRREFEMLKDRIQRLEQKKQD